MEVTKWNEFTIEASITRDRKRVYYHAKDGMAIAVYLLCSKASPELVDQLINQRVVERDGHECTPLMIAARYGHDKVVKILLDKFKPDLEQEGTVKFDGQVIEKVTALWCAAAAGYLTVVKSLVEAGANVNHPTATHCTPLRAACFNGRLDIIKYLVDHHADMNIANHFNNTCLMIATCNGHLDVVTFLLEIGANPNEKQNCGATALHLAADCGHVAIVCELLKFKAEMTKNNNGMTPLMIAAGRTRSKVVKYLIKWTPVSTEEIIDAFELLGASYANSAAHKDNYPLLKAYKYLRKAMELRFNDPENIIYKTLGEPVKAYNNWKESESLEELDSIQFDTNAIHMESLAIRERILGQHNPEVTYHILIRGAIFADNAKFDRCMELWLHALYLKQLNNVSIVKDLPMFTKIFSQMILAGAEIDFSQVLSVLLAIVTVFIRNKLRMKSLHSKEDIEQYVEETELCITSALYILSIVAKLLAVNENKILDQDIANAYCLVHKLCALELRLKDGQTLLHLAVNANTVVDDVDTYKFPCAATAKLLIRCGADVDAMDNKRNTPLHVIASCKVPNSALLKTLYSIIKDLREAGAHMDIVNKRGRTPFYAVYSVHLENLLRSRRKLSLKCMAAKVIKTYNLPYCGKVPLSLESFIELHGPGDN
ncbi:protein fem-1 homolog B [Megalopta genalis]|uniref:protein fem-1 homolog B n=1 Tax=Megalopta genalis TaxID=115081 RepID=UPI003FD4BBEF